MMKTGKRSYKKSRGSNGLTINKEKYMALTKYMNFANGIVEIIKDIKEDWCNPCSHSHSEIMLDGSREWQPCNCIDYSGHCSIARLRRTANNLVGRPSSY